MSTLPEGLTCERLILKKEAQTLEIHWSDGLHCVFPLDGLRRACPCAGCRGHANMDELPDPEIFHLPALRRWEKVRAEIAGSVGVRLQWDDGHNSGIFTWSSLRAMCPSK